jgi:hypothetical protein
MANAGQCIGPGKGRGIDHTAALADMLYVAIAACTAGAGVGGYVLVLFVLLMRGWMEAVELAAGERRYTHAQHQ